MAISGLGVAEVTAGFLLLYSGYINQSLKTTMTSLLSGKVPTSNPTGSPSIGLQTVGNTASTSGGSGGTGGTGTVNNVPASSAQVMSWIQAANMVLTSNGQALSATDIKAVELIIHYESGGNPNAVNNWDSNAAAGHPSQGLMQLIPSSFKSFALPGYNTNILDPVSNIIAGVRDARGNYGSLENVPGVVAVSAGKPYVGY